jgi:2,3-bisphosphoglycerate-independent phosphoglycerate mutase
LRDDVVIFFNFRTDRGRELTEVLTQMDCHEQNMHKLNLYYVTLTNYDETYQNIKVVYNKDNITETLGEVLRKGKSKSVLRRQRNIRMLLSFFLREERAIYWRSRILKNSPSGQYDLQPQMSAFELTEALVPEKEEVDFVCLNFATTAIWWAIQEL